MLSLIKFISFYINISFPSLFRSLLATIFEAFDNLANLGFILAVDPEV